METSNTYSNDNTYSFHKLKNKWSLYAHLPQDTDWSHNSYKLIYTFENIEEIISIINYLPETLIKNCMLFIMKDNILPMWEDPKNINGGCFSYKVINKYVCDVWRDLTYLLVGDSLSSNSNFNKNITGITISPKKNFCIIKIWMTNCDHQNPAVVAHVKGLQAQGCLFKKHTPEY